MKIILFGNRGSRFLGASEHSPFQKYGGDTTAVGIIAGSQLIGLDAGSGFYKWDWTLKNYLKRPGPHKLALLFSHYHDDHTIGLAQSGLLFNPQNEIDVIGPQHHANEQRLSLQDLFRSKANEPANPNLGNVYAAKLAFTELGRSNNIKGMVLANGVQISWLPVKHGGITAYGYRIEHEGHSMCMISDTHHEVDAEGKPVLNPAIVEFIKGADVLIYDSHFTDPFFAANTKMCQAFGHSTGEHGIRLAQAGNVPMYVVHHYDPNKDDGTLDQEMDALRAYGEERGVSVVPAQPSLCIDLSLPPEKQLAFVRRQTTPQLRYQAIGDELKLAA